MGNEKEELYFDGGMIVACTKIAAQYFGVTPATLSNWMRAGCPRLRHGYWDIHAVTEWRAMQEGEKLAAAAQTDVSLLSPSQLKVHYEAQLKQAQLESAQARNKLASGEYLVKSVVVEDLSKYFIVLKHSLMGLGREIGQIAMPFLDTDAARRMDQTINDQLREALEQMSVSGVYEVAEGDCKL